MCPCQEALGMIRLSFTVTSVGFNWEFCEYDRSVLYVNCCQWWMFSKSHSSYSCSSHSYSRQYIFLGGTLKPSTGTLKPSTCFLVSNYLEQADMTLTPRVEQRAGHRDQICWWCHADAVFWWIWWVIKTFCAYIISLLYMYSEAITTCTQLYSTILCYFETAWLNFEIITFLY